MADSPEQQEWGMRMIVVSRCLERIGDNAVDIGEQTAFLVTGEFREFIGRVTLERDGPRCPDAVALVTRSDRTFTPVT